MALVAHRTQTGLNAAHPPFYVSESDPTTTLGPYRVWFKPSTGEAWIRNAANTDWEDIVTAGGGSSVSAATEGSAGIAELATQSETDAGADDGRIVTPLKAATRFLAKAGGTLTGFLILHADPTSAMHPATKQYADSLVSGGASPASEITAGIAELATQTETNTGTDDARIVTPLKLATRTATETRAGVVELATDAEAQTGADTARALTAANLSARSATETRSGIAEVATQAETDTGTDDAKMVTPLKAATRFLAKAGGTLTGFLTLHADPTSALHAVTKQYADGLVAGGASPASETVAGVAEIATQGETDAGTDDARIVTPAKLANYSGLGSAGSGNIAGAYDIESTTYTDAGMSDEFNTDTLDAQWTVIAEATTPASGTINPYANPANAIYDLTTRTQGLLVQPRATATQDRFRMYQADALTNNESLVLSVSIPDVNVSTADIFQAAIAISTSTTFDSTNFRALWYRGTSTHEIAHYLNPSTITSRSFGTLPFGGRRLYLRITRRNTNDYWYMASFDGTNWIHVKTETSISTTFTHVWLYTGFATTASTLQPIVAFNWLRHVASANFDLW